MAYSGPWGTFIHIPKTGGTYTRSILSPGKRVGENGLTHGLPAKWNRPPYWANIRKPTEWWRSVWGHVMTQGKTTYPNDIPWKYFLDIIRPHLKGEKSFHEDSMAVMEANPGLITWFFNSYKAPNIQFVPMRFMDLRLKNMGYIPTGIAINTARIPKQKIQRELEKLIVVDNFELYTQYFKDEFMPVKN